MTGDLSRGHWIGPVHGLTPTDPEGTVQAVARRDGTVILDLICGGSRTRVWVDVCRTAQLSTGIWEAAGAAQQFSGYLGDDRPAPPQPPHGAGGLPESWRAHPFRNTSSRRISPSRRRRLTLVGNGAARDATRTIGLRLRRIREARGKSLEVISGLAGMWTSTLHHVEYGRRELTLSEIVTLAHGLKIDPAELIMLPTPAWPVSHHGRLLVVVAGARGPVFDRAPAVAHDGSNCTMK